MEPLIFIAIIVVVGLLRLIAQAVENKKNAEAERRGGAPAAPTATLPTQRPSPNSEEERVRKFMEALGIPTATSPPRKVQPRSVTPKAPRPTAQVPPIDPFPKPPRMELPPIFTPAPRHAEPPPMPAPAHVPTTATPVPTRETTMFAEAPQTPTSAALPRAEFEVRDLSEAMADDLAAEQRSRQAAARARTDVPETSVAARLATTQGLRDAMVLREIFGPPRSMQPLGRQIAG